MQLIRLLPLVLLFSCAFAVIRPQSYIDAITAATSLRFNGDQNVLGFLYTNSTTDPSITMGGNRDIGAQNIQNPAAGADSSTTTMSCRNTRCEGAVPANYQTTFYYQLDGADTGIGSNPVPANNPSLGAGTAAFDFSSGGESGLFVNVTRDHTITITFSIYSGANPSNANRYSYALIIPQDANVGTIRTTYFIPYNTWTLTGSASFRAATAFTYVVEGDIALDWILHTFTPYANTINGRVFKNCGNDCQFDSGTDTPLSGVNLRATSSTNPSVDVFTAISNLDGTYSIGVFVPQTPGTQTYTVCITDTTLQGGLPNGFTVATDVRTCFIGGTPTASCGTVSATFLGDVNNVDFAVYRAPTIVAPATSTSECSTSVFVAGTPSVSTTLASTFVTCTGTVTYSDSTAQPCQAGNSGARVVSRTWQVTDSRLITATSSQTINILDNTPPSITAPNPTTLDCSQRTTPAASAPTSGTPTYSDICSIPASLTLQPQPDVPNPGNTGCLSTITRTWQVTDACGLTARTSQALQFTDTVAPSWIFPQTQTFQCANPLPTASFSSPTTLTDNCATPSLQVSTSPITSGTACLYTISRTFTLTDGCNTIQNVQSIVIEDTQPPAIGSVASGTEFTDCTNIQINPPTASDACLGSVTPNVVIPDTPINISDGCRKTFQRTWTVQDGCGFSTSTFATYVVVDQTAPTSNSPSSFTIDCVNAQSTPRNTPVAVDVPNCNTPSANFVSQSTPGSTACDYTFTRTWSLTDSCATNSRNFVQTYFVEDNTPPTATFNPISQVSTSITCGYFVSPAGANNDPTLITAALFSIGDDCQPAPTIQSSTAAFLGSGASPVTCYNPVRRTYTFTDNCSNTVAITQDISITDTAPPVVSPPGDFSTSCDFNAGNTNTAQNTAATASDVCWGSISPSIINIQSSGDVCGAGLIYTRTWGATDQCGNQGTAIQRLTVTDITAPTMTAPVGRTQSCVYDGTNLGTGSSFDRCDASLTVGVVSTTPSSSTCTAAGRSDVYVVTWRATDECGLSGESVQLVTVQDNTPPSINGITTISYSCSASTAVRAGDIPTFSDNCNTGSLTATPSDGAIVAGTCANSYSFLRTWSGTDNCLTTTFVQTVNVVDSIAPVITPGFTNSFTVDCTVGTGATFGAITSWAPAPGPTSTVTAADTQCTNTVVTITFSDGIPSAASNCDSTILRTWVATDTCGNSVTGGLQTFSLVDTAPPVFGSISSGTVTCQADTAPTLLPLSFAVTASDSCDTSLSITSSDVTNTSDPCRYVITRTWTARDDCTNSVTAIQTITAVDVDTPIITPPSAAFYDCLAGTADDSWSVSDPCGRQNLRSSVTISTQTTPCSGTPGSFDSFQRVYSVVDTCGQSTVATQVFTLIDSTGPSFNAPPTWISNDCNNTATQLFPATAVSGIPNQPVDACSRHDLGTNYNFGTQDILGSSTACRTTGTRIWTTQDLCGNTASREQLMNVVDNTQPRFDVFPPSTSVACTVTQTAPTTTDSIFFFPSFSDDCQVPSLTYSDSQSIGCSPVISRTWTIDDGCNLPVSRIQRVTLLDNSPPVIQDLPDLTLDCSSTTQSQTTPRAPFGTGQAAVPTVFDICDNTPSLTFSDTVFGDLCPDSQLIVRTWLASDDCLNTSTEVVNIRIQLNQLPTLTLPNDAIVDCSEGTLPAFGTRVGTATASQACGVAVTLTYQDTLSFNVCPEIIQRLWVARDECGNVRNGIQTITVTDNQDPQFLTIPPSVTINCEEDTHPQNTGFPLVSDNCDIPVCSITWYDVISEVGEQIGTCKRDQRIRRTFVARDSCENESTATQDIFIEYVEVSVPCDGVACTQDACKLCECDISKLNCECCERGGAASCLPVNCNAVACSPKANCNPVPCIACEIDLNDSTSPLPFCDNSTVPCIPNIIPIFVDDEDPSTAIPDPDEGDFDSDYWKDRAAYWRERFQGEEIQAASTSQLAPLIALLVLLLSLPFTFYTFLLN